MRNAVNWFEIPVKDYNRAKQFYSTVMGSKITDHPMPEQNIKYGIFEYDEDNNCVGGAIIEGEGQNPTTDGATIYLNGGDNLNDALEKVEVNGGKIMMPKTDIGTFGFIAQFIDTEGNLVALHSIM
ncbi:VOC family protein [Psychroserpens algicola]|uniref:VOC family protein n=1 Tax=Psychroserpens algicola TaxID=1719034 RepID=A0ABT0H5L3_9FLAO|nr:VOC family protein [Psychroserpens algicola]MCK8479658.1 VOC family protein [Psychroserpens algicola]